MSASKLGRFIINDVTKTITELRARELLRDENGISAVRKSGEILEITYANKNETSKILFDKHISCSYLIDELLRNRQYTILLYDKSFIQAEFIVSDNTILKQRLFFVKKHNRIWSSEDIRNFDALDEDWFSEDEGIPIIFRVDFDKNAHKECEHPMAHLTFSNHENCRIPIRNAITFSEFIRFVLFHFYDLKLNFPHNRFDLEDSITELEKTMLHIAWN